MLQRTIVTLLVYGLLQVALFSIGVVTVLTTSPMKPDLPNLIPWIAAGSMGIAAMVAWKVAPLFEFSGRGRAEASL
jgi:hypothetical protein